MPDYNLHQHSIFSDGNSPLEDYVKQAIEIGFTQMGFTEHSPLPFDNPFSLKNSEIDNYVNETIRLKAKYKSQIEILRSLEMDFIPGCSEDFSYWADKIKTDYLIGSIHLVSNGKKDEIWFTDGPDRDVYDQGVIDYFDGDIKKAVRAFFHQTNEMISSQKFDIIGHFDKIKMHNADRFFSDNDQWYKDLLNETIHLIKEKALIVEINTRGLYKKRSIKLFPDNYALQKVKELNIPIIISSDAHKPNEINLLFEFTVDYLKKLDFKEMMKFENNQWKKSELK